MTSNRPFGWSNPDPSVLFRRAERLLARPEASAPDELAQLCQAVEVVLQGLLREDPRWPGFDWLDGFAGHELERTDRRLTLRGAMWVNAEREEPCEAEIDLAQVPHRAFLRLGIAEGREEPMKSKIRRAVIAGALPVTEWVYSYEVRDAS
jgi:hypothetical protein